MKQGAYKSKPTHVDSPVPGEHNAHPQQSS